jgi:hypothetical protein
MRHSSTGHGCYYRLAPNEIAGSYSQRRPNFLRFGIVDGSRNEHDDLPHRLATPMPQ